MNKYHYIGVRLPDAVDTEIREIAVRSGIPPAVLIRSITMEWIERRNEKTALGGNLPGTTPSAVAHRTHKGVDADGIIG